MILNFFSLLDNNKEGMEERHLMTHDELTDFLLYTAPGGNVKVECVLHNESVWLTQKRIAELLFKE